MAVDVEALAMNLTAAGYKLALNFDVPYVEHREHDKIKICV